MKPIYIEINGVKGNDKDANGKTILTWKNYNKNDLINILTYEHDWTTFQQQDINGKVEILRENLIKAAEKSTKTIKWKNSIKCNSWFDDTMK